MVDRFVGIGGNDGNSGLTWALRKLTLNGVEDTPVVANDTVYVGPGVYRELLTCDVSGNAGNPITYIADVTGENTDNIGGIVRVTGSDNDQTAARAVVIALTTRDYRIFRGFRFDSGYISDSGVCTNLIVEDCVFEAAGRAVWLSSDPSDFIFRRCFFLGGAAGGTLIDIGTNELDASGLIENCIVMSNGGATAIILRSGGIDVRNCLIMGRGGINVSIGPGGATACNVNNCIIRGASQGLVSSRLGDLVEDFNNLEANSADRTNVNIGANSVSYLTLLTFPILNSGVSQVSGFKFPWWFGELSEWSQIRAITGNNEPVEDLHGIVRPTTAAKNSWGPSQFVDMELESGTVQAGTYARVLHDAGQVLVRRIPVTGVQITVTLYMRRETNYAGNLPRMIIKQPGSADRATITVAAVDTWEQLTDTFTPTSPPGYVEVWAESRNTAVALAYEVFYDTMEVT